MRNVQYGNGEIYHVYNRGANSHLIYLDDADRIRFLKGLMLFNDEEVLPTGKALLQLWQNPKKAEKQLVTILSYTLMDNHYHLVLEQLVDRGIEKFMQRLSLGYTKYRNQRYGSKGVVFGSPYKAVHIATEEQFLHITRYVHLNPYDHHDYGWREGKARSRAAVSELLRVYHWSSYRAYIGLEINPLINSTRILDCFKDSQDYEGFVISWTTRSADILSGLTIDDNTL